MSALDEIDAIINLIEAALPASITKPENIAMADKLEKALAKYFEDMANAFPYHRAEAVYTDNVKEALGWDWLNGWLKAFEGSLLEILGKHLADIYYAGSMQVISYGKTKMGIPIAYEGPPMSQAVNWARDYGSKLVTKMSDESRSRLAQIISDGIQNKRGLEGLASDIRKEFEDMSVTRSRLIAKTETGNALGQSFLDRNRDMGVDGKEWVLGSGGREGNCQDCIDNADAGVIPIEQEFPSGVMTVLQHPGCTCACAPAMLKRKEE